MKRHGRSDSKIVVFAHVHYPEIWPEMSAALEDRLRLPFHLLVTSSHPESLIHPPQTPALVSYRFLSVENRGRDILPFLRAFAQAGEFDFGLKLHSKKSPQREDGALWRADLLTSLLPSPNGTSALVKQMQLDPRIGFVAPDGFCLSVEPWIFVNRPGMDRVATLLDHTLGDEDLKNAFFAAGSMFWFRKSALEPLVHPDLPSLFEPEEAQFDGTTAHAMERLFPVVGGRRGFISLAAQALTVSGPTMSRAQVLALAQRHADIPNRYFPAPYLEALPLEAPPTSPLIPLSKKPIDLASQAYRAIVPRGLRLSLRRLFNR